MAEQDSSDRADGLRRLGHKDRDRIRTALEGLPEGDVKRLRGPERLWRLRVGEWRVIFDRRSDSA